MRKAVSR